MASAVATLPAGSTATTSSTTGSNKSISGALDQMLNGADFLQLFLTQIQNQSPLEPLSNSDMMSQIAQMTQVEGNQEFLSKMNSLTNQSSILQASGLIGHSVQYGDTNVQSLVSGVQVDKTGAVSLALQNGATIGISDITKIV